MMPAGKYWVGDLCYVISDDDWYELLEVTDYKDGEFILNGTHFAIYGTEHGDGTYEDTDGNAYNVDSGTIGCIPVSAISKTSSFDGGHVHNFPTPFRTGSNNGVIFFNDLEIDTDE